MINGPVVSYCIHLSKGETIGSPGHTAHPMKNTDMVANTGRPIPPPPPEIGGSLLLRRLDETLRKRADEIVEASMAQVAQQASAPVATALAAIIGSDNRAALAAAELRIADAINDIARDVKQHAYQALVTRAINCLAAGQDFNPSN